MREVLFTGDQIRVCRENDRHWKDAPAAAENIPKGSVYDSFLLGRLPGELSSHYRVQELIGQEKPGRSGTMCIIVGVREEWIEVCVVALASPALIR